MSLLQFSRFRTSKPDRTLWEKSSIISTSAAVSFFKDQVDRLMDSATCDHTRPAHTTHWEARQSHQDECELCERRRGIREEGTKVGTGSPEAAEFFLCAQNKLLHAVVSVASGNGTRRKNQQHWVHLTYSLMTHHLAFDALTHAILIEIPHENKCF